MVINLRNQQGWIAIVVMLVMAIALIYATALSAMSGQEYAMALYNKQEVAAMYSAEAGMEVMRVYIDDAIRLLNEQIQSMKREREAQGLYLTKDEVYGIISNYMNNWCNKTLKNVNKSIYNYKGQYCVNELIYYDYLKYGYKVFPHVLFLQVTGSYGKGSATYNGDIQLNVDDSTLMVNMTFLMWGKVN